MVLRSKKEYPHKQTTGFQSPAEDYIERRLNIAELIIRDPENTFYQIMDTEAMSGCGIQKGSIVVIDRSIVPKSGDIISVWIRSEWLIRRLDKRAGKVHLLSENQKFESITVSPDDEMIVDGVVTWGNMCHCKRFFPEV